MRSPMRKYSLLLGMCIVSGVAAAQESAPNSDSRSRPELLVRPPRLRTICDL